MRLTFALCAMLLSGCADYKCVDGVMYNRVQALSDTYAVSSVFKDVPCKEIK
jgi:hypothetical protein